MDTTITLLNNNIMLASLLTGWLLDLLFGDPQRLPHPIVYMGRWIAWGEHKLNRGNARKAKGAIFALGSIIIVFAAAWLTIHLLGSLAAHGSTPSPLYTVLLYTALSLSVFFCLAGKTLRQEVSMVFQALGRSLDDGRRQVARIVGRDTQHLSRQEVATAALETLAENLSDGVMAPLFWFSLLGVSGMLAYKMVNTLDSMIGYQNKRYKDFGCWAARIDDIANYVPARLTALLMLLAGRLCPRLSARQPRQPLRSQLRTVVHYSRCHASPNSGWPEAALSTLLDCRFGGPHDYFGELFYKPYIGSNPRPVGYPDMLFSIRLCLMAEGAAVAICLALCAL